MLSIFGIIPHLILTRTTWDRQVLKPLGWTCLWKNSSPYKTFLISTNWLCCTHHPVWTVTNPCEWHLIYHIFFWHQEYVEANFRHCVIFLCLAQCDNLKDKDSSKNRTTRLLLAKIKNKDWIYPPAWHNPPQGTKYVKWWFSRYWTPGNERKWYLRYEKQMNCTLPSTHLITLSKSKCGTERRNTEEPDGLPEQAFCRSDHLIVKFE